MKYEVVMQEEVYGKTRIPTQCKRLRSFPIEGKKKQGTSWCGIKFPLLQVIVQDEKGSRLRFKLNLSDGIEFPKFVVQHPNRMQHPTIIVGEGKRKKEIPDLLSPMVEVQGVKENYDATDFEKRITQVCGAAVATEVLNLFAQKTATLALAA